MAGPLHEPIASALAAGRDEVVLRLLTDLPRLERACAASVDGLLQDFALALRAAERPLPDDAEWVRVPAVLVDRFVLSLLEGTIAAFREPLKSDPGLLFPALYNQLYWYDCPERQAHGAPSRPGPERRVHQLMEDWRAEYERRPGAAWLRSVRPPKVLVAEAPSFRLEGECRLHPSGELLLVEHRDRADELADARTGKMLARPPLRTNALSGDGAHLLSRDKKELRLLAVGPGGALTERGAFAGYGGPDYRTELQHAALSEDAATVFTSTYHELTAWRVSDGARLATTSVDRSLEGLLPCGPWLLLLQAGGVTLWDPATGTFPMSHLTDTLTGPAVAVSPARDVLVTFAEHGDRSLLEGFALPDGRPLFRIRREMGGTMSFHPGGAFFAVSHWRDKKRASLHDVRSGELLHSIPGDGTTQVSIDPSGTFLLLGGQKSVQLWHLEDRAVHAELPGEGAATWSADGRRLALAKGIVYDLATSLTPPLRDDDLGFSRWQVFSPGGKSVVSEYDDGFAIWETARGLRRKTVEAERIGYRFPLLDRNRLILCRPQGSPGLTACASDDGREVFTIDLGGDATQSIQEAPGLKGFLITTKGALVIGLAFDGHEIYRLRGELLCAGRNVLLLRAPDGSIGVYAPGNGRELSRMPPVEGKRFVLSPDEGKVAVFGFEDLRVELWDLGRKALLRTFDGGDPEGRCIVGVTFSANGLTLQADGREDKGFFADNDDVLVWEWNVDTGALLRHEGWRPPYEEPEPTRSITLPGGLRFETGDGIYRGTTRLVATPELTEAVSRDDGTYLTGRAGRVDIHQLRTLR